MPMTLEISPQLEQRLRDEKTVWLTTVRTDGTPQPVPVWFLWDDETFLIFSQPKAQKLRNIAHNSKVALNFKHTDDFGEEGLVMIFGAAFVDPTVPPSNQIAAYLEKYLEGIKDINMTPDSLAAEFSVAIRVKPTRVRGNG
jgi:PPOX class probable F420-dependent enzyme